jgi:hypothetical protein
LNERRQLQIAWEGRPDVSYQLQSRLDIAAGVWTDVGAVTAGQLGPQMTTVDIGTEALRVFRVVER